uniref:GH50 n=1 Tax=uncultured Armatimonadetes bacterium TaxID=157466 RepID=A0A6J4I0U6_9BACT|nr:GH50 [uncultured Armatimonadetes bacterium]
MTFRFCAGTIFVLAVAAAAASTAVLAGGVAGQSKKEGATAAGAAPLPPVKVKYRVSDAEWQVRTPRTPEMLAGFTASAYPAPALNRWGGRTDRKVAPTGFFHARKIGERWWLVDPDGGLFLHVGVAGVDPGRTPASRAALGERFGTPERWAAQTTGYLRGLGFNGAGAWSGVGLLRAAPAPRLVYTVIGNTTGAPGGGTGGGGFMSNFGKKLKATRPGVGHTNYPDGCIPVFHPDFPAFCDEYARPLAGLKNDPWLLGYFSDNELPFPRLEKYLALPPDDPAMGSSYRAAREWIDARRGSTGATAADLTQQEKDAWTEHVYDRYLALTTGATRKYDPNHMCLGPRFYGPEKDSPAAFRAAGRHLDVLAVNLYFVWSPKPADIGRWTAWSGKPVMITEWYAKGMDSGLPNTSGAGWTVPTQEDRGLFYQTFTLGLLESGNCVGWHWFKYLDNDPNDPNAEASNRDANKGMVTGRFAPYAPLVDRMSSLNHSVYAVTDYFDREKRRP